MRNLIYILLFLPFFGFAQFDGPGGTSGSKSVHKEDASIIGWATTCTVERGWLNAADTSKGKVDHGIDSNGLGSFDGAVVSLGDGGVATLEFESPILNQDGYDFAVFENGFKVGLSFYLELAHVEVSKDGINYVRFPSETTLDTTFQTDNFFYTRPEEVYNLAGKHQAPYGTLFDLEEIGLDTVNYVRIVDVIGSINREYGSVDSKGTIINDPYPSEFPSGGFDLDAVAVVNGTVLKAQQLVQNKVILYPNPARINATIRTNERFDKLEVLTVAGQHVLLITKPESQFHLPSSGFYIVKITRNGITTTTRLCVN